MDYEAEYNNRRRVPEHVAISAAWRAESAAYRGMARDAGRADLDLPYGPSERQQFDMFLSGVVGAPLVAYIHGGYWQWGDRTGHSRLARDLNAHGVDVALPSYSLCPSVAVVDIIGEIRRFLTALWERTHRYPLVVAHSAGGHLAAAMVATDWSAIADVPDDLVRSGVAISGLFDLEPLLTTSMNDALRLSRETAHAASPRFWSPPPDERRFVAVAGELESSEFRRQNRDMGQPWGTVGLETQYIESARKNHYTVLDELTQPASELFARVVTMARLWRKTGHRYA